MHFFTPKNVNLSQNIYNLNFHLDINNHHLPTKHVQIANICSICKKYDYMQVTQFSFCHNTNCPQSTFACINLSLLYITYYVCLFIGMLFRWDFIYANLISMGIFSTLEFSLMANGHRLVQQLASINCKHPHASNGQHPIVEVVRKM